MIFLLDSKLFADDTSIVLVIHDEDLLANEPNEKWKLFFYEDLTKQAQEVNFSCKSNKSNHPRV